MATYQIIDANGAKQFFDTGSGAGTSGSPFTGKSTFLGDGTNQFLSGSAANLAAATPAINAQLVVRVGDWSVTHSPAVNTQATITKAAGSAGVRHVITAISFTLCQDATGGTPFTGIVNLRDGASGAGTILATWNIGVVTAACSNSAFHMENLNIVGSAATAATLEFTSTAPGAHTLESVHLTGYDTV